MRYLFYNNQISFAAVGKLKGFFIGYFAAEQLYSRLRLLNFLPCFRRFHCYKAAADLNKRQAVCAEHIQRGYCAGADNIKALAVFGFSARFLGSGVKDFGA